MDWYRCSLNISLEKKKANLCLVLTESPEGVFRTVPDIPRTSFALGCSKFDFDSKCSAQRTSEDWCISNKGKTISNSLPNKSHQCLSLHLYLSSIKFCEIYSTPESLSQPSSLKIATHHHFSTIKQTLVLI